jgi:hypothetical protein
MSPAALAIGVTVVLVAVYAYWTPSSPDLAAQVARADLVRRAGAVSWWTGWFGGLSLPTYSVFVPWSMAAIGVRVTGVLAVVVGAAAGGVLSRDALRPRAGAVGFALAGVADLLAGRVTFAVGLAIAVCALVAVRSHRSALGAGLAVTSFLASPLAGLFVGLVLIAIAVTDASRRRKAGLSAAALLLAGTGMAVLYPGTGVMPFNLRDMIAPTACCVLVLWACPSRVVRVSALLVLAALPAFFIVPGAVGANIARFAWVCAAPILISCGRWDRRWLVTALVGLVVWPALDLVSQIAATRTPSTRAAFYQPLAAELRREQAAAAPAATGERVEVVDTINHWASVYVARSTTIARGWDRQADNADNPIFYREDALTAASYHEWLHELAVGWVAVPTAPLDSASVQEARLIRGGLNYLSLSWTSHDWKLYHVIDAAPLAIGATTVGVTASSITLRRSTPGVVTLRVRYSPYFAVVDATTRRPLNVCVTDAGGWTRIDLPAPATFSLTSPFSAKARLHSLDGDYCGQGAATTAAGP